MVKRDYENTMFQVQMDAMRNLRDRQAATIAELEARNAELEAKLETDSAREIEAEREVVKLGKQLRFVQGQLRRNTDEFHYNSVHKAIYLVGRAYQQALMNDDKDLAARLKLALSTLNAKPVGEIDDIVEFDGRQELPKQPRLGTPVRILAPSIVYRTEYMQVKAIAELA